MPAFWFPGGQDPEEGSMDPPPPIPLSPSPSPPPITQILCPVLCFSLSPDFHGSQELSILTTSLALPRGFLLTFSHCPWWLVQLVIWPVPQSCHRVWLRTLGLRFQNHFEHLPSILRQAHFAIEADTTFSPSFLFSTTVTW